jgi:plasmid stabilization system protein ParE
MNYSVEWTNSAQQDLAALWVSSSDRGAVTAAADAIDVTLGRDPLGQGESRQGSARVMFLPPLGVYYDVDQVARRVTVRAVWHTSRRP